MIRPPVFSAIANAAADFPLAVGPAIKIVLKRVTLCPEVSHFKTTFRTIAAMTAIATLIAKRDSRALNAELANAVFKSLVAEGVSWLSPHESVEFEIAADADDADQREFYIALISSVIGERPIDIAILDPNNRRKKLLIADMDSTMIEQECIDELADMAGVKDQVSAITKRAMNGEIAFEPALIERVALLKGLPVSIISTVIADRISYMPGGHTLVSTMKAHGAFCALVSGGFTAFANPIGKELGFNVARANVLGQDKETLDGTVAFPILGREAKVEALEHFCAELKITPNDALAVGDGANDLGMIKKAGLGVALHAKPSVSAEARVRIDHSDHRALLFLQGYRVDDFVGAL
jgi:phosphoserine phosphatase